RQRLAGNLLRKPRLRRDRPCEPGLHLGHVRGDTGRRVNLRELAHEASPVWRATIEPASKRKRTALKPASRSMSARRSAVGNRFTEAGRYVYASPPGSTLPSSGTTRSNQRE